jgi:integrase
MDSMDGWKMAKPRSAKFETPTARLKHAVSKKPYTAAKLARGVFLDYRRNKGPGTWIVRAANGHGAYWTKGLGDADDLEKADGNTIFDYWSACERALVFARGNGEEPGAAPVFTVDVALIAYGKNLEALGGDTYNARRPRRYLTAKLLNRPVSVLGESGATELAEWRDGLLKQGLSRSSVKRICICLRAALNLAHERDPIRIPITAGWRIGLGGIDDATNARRVVIPDESVLRLVAAAFEVEYRFGLLIAVIAAVGPRLSQVARLRVVDLEANHCRLQMPSSRKGKRRKTTYEPVPIPQSLVDMLGLECKGRGPEEPLLRCADGAPWPHGRHAKHQKLLCAAAERAGLDPALTTYWLRHSSIARSLLAGTPVAITAKLHNTSTREIERHYGRYILDHSDQLARRGLIDLPVTLSPAPMLPAP